MSKTWIVAAVVALAGAAALWLLARDDARADDVARPVSAAGPSDARSAADLVGEAPASDASEPDVARAGSIGGERVAAPAAAERTSAPGFDVVVVRADDATPVAGADVRAFAGKIDGIDEERARDLARLDAWMDEHGVALRTDASGVVRVPLHDEHATLVVASDGGLWGRAWLAAPDDGDDAPELELSPDLLLRALVVDGAGAPVEGVTVQLRKVRRSGWAHDLASARSGADGIARFLHVQTHKSEDGDGWRLRLEAVAEREIAADVDPAAVPAEPVRLALPATGAVVVRVLDALGEPWLAGAQVTLSAIPDGEPRDASPFAPSARATFRREAEGGVAAFPHVALGVELAISARRQRAGVETHAYLPGPTAPGEELDVPLAFGADHAVVVVRVIGVDGTPLVDTDLLVDLDLSSAALRSTTRQHPRSDAGGRIRIDVAAGHAEGSRRDATIVLGPRDAPEATGELDLGRDLPAGRSDLGDVRLAPPLAFVRGRVVDETGAGVAGARVEISSSEDGDWWQQAYDVTATAGDDGAFAVMTDVAGERFRAQARKSGHASVPVEFARGGDVLLRMTLEGAITGSLLVDDGLPLAELQVTVRSADESARRSPWRGVGIESDGTFRASELSPGLHAVTIAGSGLELVSVPDVLVVSGRDTADPRLQIDLRGKLHAFRLTLVRPDGKKELQGDYQTGPAGAEQRDRWGWFNGTEVVILSTDAAIDVDLSPRGFAPVELRDLRGDRTVELSEGLFVRVRLAPGSTLPEPPYFVHPALVPDKEGGESIDWGTPAFDERREVLIKGLTPGRVRLQWILERREGSSAMATLVGASPEQAFDILPGVEGQVIEVVLEREALDESIASLGW